MNPDYCKHCKCMLRHMSRFWSMVYPWITQNSSLQTVKICILHLNVVPFRSNQGSERHSDGWLQDPREQHGDSWRQHRHQSGQRWSTTHTERATQRKNYFDINLDLKIVLFFLQQCFVCLSAWIFFPIVVIIADLCGYLFLMALLFPPIVAVAFCFYSRSWWPTKPCFDGRPIWPVVLWGCY